METAVETPVWPEQFRPFCMEQQLPEGRSSGPWKIIKRTAPMEHDVETLRLVRQGRPLILGLTYTMLVHEDRGIVMSDTPAEIQDHATPYLYGKGRVLINGLGLGMLPRALLTKPEVQLIDIVEIDPHVVALHPELQNDPRVRIHVDDALVKTWPRGTFWSVVWHDIWDTISSSNLIQMSLLHDRYRRRCCWQGSWCRAQCQALRRKGY